MSSRGPVKQNQRDIFFSFVARLMVRLVARSAPRAASLSTGSRDEQRGQRILVATDVHTGARWTHASSKSRAR